jgi:hypothetical protein
MKFADIPQFTKDSPYKVNVGWDDLARHFDHYRDIKKNDPEFLQLDPDFQRGHVWTEEKQIAYIEFVLKGGKSSRELQFNCPGWMNSFKGPMQLVDGKQRLQAVQRFMNNEIPAFGFLLNQFEGNISWRCDFVFCINDLKTRKEVLNWYLELNSGGVVHTQEELDRVRQLLEDEIPQ